ncbi:Phosphate transport system permease protein PstA [Planctomycetes bacterium CA13]|uniref:Phosphate transport system permease protein PstA n=1 Tax=Novipirellula herctigrandis TaxID=2527986 RepID=A0A5C5Z7D1_9BACT|nr:Phosphate transport system permease protein PstA [Planctomycetes bacterium CA13]
MSKEKTEADDIGDSGIAQRLAKVEPVDNRRRLRHDNAFRILCVGIATVSVLVLIALLTSIIVQGIPSLSWVLLSGTPEPEPTEAGMFPALMGTIWICSLCALITLPVGVATAVLLEEFKPRTKVAAWFYSVIQLNISNLAGVPSVVYGILGLTAFVSMFSLFGNAKQPGAAVWEVGATYYDQFSNVGSDPFLTMGQEVDERYFLVPVEKRSDDPTVPTEGMVAFENRGDGLVPAEVHVVDAMAEMPTDPEALATSIDSLAVPGRISEKAWYYFQLPFGRGVLAGALTLMLVILPVIIISTQEALRAVPSSLRDGALGIGATPWQVVWNVTLPSAIPGIMTGSILAMSRAVGETAPILIIAGIVYIRNAPQHLMDSYTVMPLQIYNWTSRPQDEFHSLAAGGIIILLGILLSFNAIAVMIRHRMQKPLS